MKSKILAGAIALALMLTPTVASYASENINDKEVYLECDDCIKDNDIEITLCEEHAKELNNNDLARCGGDVGLATGPNGNVVSSLVRSWYDAPLYPNLGNYYFTTRQKVGTNTHSMVGIWNNRSSSNYVTAWIEDGSGKNITQNSWQNLNTQYTNYYYQINTPGAYYKQSVRLGIESHKAMTYTGYCDGVVDYH